MESKERFQKKRMERILLTLTKGLKSSEGYNSYKQYFYQDPNSKPFIIGSTEVKTFPKGLNESVQWLYQLIGDPQSEVYVKEWTFFSLEQALSLYKDYQENGQERMFDIAYRYYGLGTVEVLSCDLQTHKLYIQLDGGANGWDQEYNKKNRYVLNPDTVSQMRFMVWWDQLK